MIFLNRTDALLQLYDILKVQTLTWAFQERKREGGGRGSWWPPVLAVQIGAEPVTSSLTVNCRPQVILSLPWVQSPKAEVLSGTRMFGKKNIKRGLEQSPKA